MAPLFSDDFVPARFSALITWAKRAEGEQYTARQVRVRFSQLLDLLDLASELWPIARSMSVTLFERDDEVACWQIRRSNAPAARARLRPRRQVALLTRREG